MDRLPEPIADRLRDLIVNLEIKLVMCNSRKTKLGDWMFSKGSHSIHINNDLSPEQFFLTLIHEIAHVTTWNKYMRTVKPHGKEWKQEFRNHMLPLLVGHFSPEVEETLFKHMKNPSACSGRDIDMVRAIDPEHTLLEDVPLGITFKMSNGILLEKIKKRRTSWLCKEPLSGKEWVVPGSIRVF